MDGFISFDLGKIDVFYDLLDVNGRGFFDCVLDENDTLPRAFLCVDYDLSEQYCYEYAGGVEVFDDPKALAIFINTISANN